MLRRYSQMRYLLHHHRPLRQFVPRGNDVVNLMVTGARYAYPTMHSVR